MRHLMLLGGVVLLHLATASICAAEIAITLPADGSGVRERPIVEGTVSDPRASVWVIVHPLEVSDCWVQPATTVRATGAWKVQIHIGRPGSIDVGKHFEIRAVVDPERSLSEGLVLDGWPSAKETSEVVEVRREQ